MFRVTPSPVNLYIAHFAWSQTFQYIYKFLENLEKSLQFLFFENIENINWWSLNVHIFWNTCHRIFYIVVNDSSDLVNSQKQHTSRIESILTTKHNFENLKNTNNIENTKIIDNIRNLKILKILENI